MENWRKGRGDPAPAVEHVNRYQVVWPKPGRPIAVTVLDETWLRITTHFLPEREGERGRTVGCDGEETCQYCAKGIKQRCSCYFAALSHPNRLRVVVMTTLRGMDAILHHLVEAPSFRGAQIVIGRLTEHPNSTITVGSMPRVPLNPLPPAHCMRATLESLYGGTTIAGFYERSINGKDGTS